MADHNTLHMRGVVAVAVEAGVVESARSPAVVDLERDFVTFFFSSRGPMWQMIQLFVGPLLKTGQTLCVGQLGQRWWEAVGEEYLVR